MVTLVVIFLVLFVAAVVGLFKLLIHVLTFTIRKIKAAVVRRHLQESERLVLEATADPNITKLVLWLREDIEPNRHTYITNRYRTSFSHHYDNRCRTKLDAICAKPHLALAAFLAALNSKNQDMRYVGIFGLAYLKHADGITPLLDLYRANIDLRSQASLALVELSAIAPSEGRNSFFVIFQHFLKTPLTDHAIDEKILLLQKLLASAIARTTEFSDQDYHALFGWTAQYADLLVASQDRQTRHKGEDLKRRTMF